MSTALGLMNAVVELSEADPAARLAFRLCPRNVRTLLPVEVPGTYLLLAEGCPVYVGRSDTCLRTRLATHNRREDATHVIWQPTQGAREAYVLEAFWYHKHAPVLNRIHPASPARIRASCPFCSLLKARLVSWTMFTHSLEVQKSGGI